MRDYRRAISTLLSGEHGDRNRPLAIVTLFILLLATGCVASTVNRSQYERLKLAMTPTEVEGILGKGKALDAAEVQRLLKEGTVTADPAAGGDSAADPIDPNELRGARWGTEKKNITVIYRNDRLFRRFQQGL